jgi:NAD(P)H-hydrate epimerase
MKVNTASEKDVRRVVKKHAKDSHKGENGCVLVIGGCEHYVSAPALSASAALRTGIDLIQVASSEQAAYAINSFSIDFITKKFKGKHFAPKHLKELIPFANTFDSVLIGPGLGKNPATKKFVNQFVSKCKINLVIDADALQQIDRKKIRGLVCPHEREFEMAFGKRPPRRLKERIALTQKMAKKHKCVILLKGPADIISDGPRVTVNKTGNEGMTVGGTGDLLSGLCAGFIAQGNDLFDSAVAAAFVNGKIGDLLLKEKGYGFVSSDFIPLIPKVLFKK